MEATTPSNVELELIDRMMTIHRIQVAFLKRQGGLPKRFRRGSVQQDLCKEVGIPFTGLNKRLVNEALLALGYIKITVDGIRMYRKA